MSYGAKWNVYVNNSKRGHRGETPPMGYFFSQTSGEVNGNPFYEGPERARHMYVHSTFENIGSETLRRHTVVRTEIEKDTLIFVRKEM